MQPVFRIIRTHLQHMKRAFPWHFNPFKSYTPVGKKGLLKHGLSNLSFDREQYSDLGLVIRGERKALFHKQ